MKFRLIDVTTEQNNNKEKDDEKRKFMLYEKGDSDDESIETFSYDSENKILTISFIYDIPKDKSVHIKTEDLEDDIKKWVETNANDIMLNVFELQRTNDKKQKTLLGKHLEAYIAKNTFDYFIHKDLKGFLDRELDFFIKSEVMHLEDLNTNNEKQVDSYLLKVKAIKKVGEIIIDFLASVENFQKKLWLKKKFIIETNWCISLDKIDESFYDEIRNNKAQIDEWIDLYAINEVEGFTDIPNVEFLKKNTNLIVDTINFTNDFKERLLETINELDENTNGLLVNGDNFHAERLLLKKYANKIKLIYSDPPYNTGNGDFLYKDNFFDSSWLTFIANREKESIKLLNKEGISIVHIDEHEFDNLSFITKKIYGDNNKDFLVWQKTDSKVDKNTNAKIINRFKSVHEYLNISYINKKESKLNKMMRKPEWNNQQKNVDNDPRGNWQSGIISYEEGHENEDINSEYYYEIESPSGIKWKRMWFVTKNEMSKLINENRIYFGSSPKFANVPRLKTFENEDKEYYMETILRGVGTSSTAKDELLNLFNNREIFSTPKPSKLAKEIIRVCTNSNDIIMDCYE